MPARSYHHGDLRRALVEATLELARETGSFDLSLRQIARKAQVSHAAPYNHFDDKNALLAAAAAAGFERLHGVMLQAAQQADPADATPETDAMAAVGRAYVRFGLDNTALYRLMFGPAAISCEEECLERNASAAFQLLLDVLARRLVRQGLAPSPEWLERLGLGAWAYVHGLTLLALDGKIPTELALDLVTDWSPPSS